MGVEVSRGEDGLLVSDEVRCLDKRGLCRTGDNVAKKIILLKQHLLQNKEIYCEDFDEILVRI